MRNILYVIFFAVPFWLLMLSINLIIRTIVFIIDEPEISILTILLLLLIIINKCFL
jgi:hypothetical protein